MGISTLEYNLSEKLFPHTRVLCGIISEEFYSVFTTVGATASDSIAMGWNIFLS